MGKYIVKRVILAIFTIFIISLITFFAMNAIPGGPFNSEKGNREQPMKPARILQIRVKIKMRFM